MKMKPVSPRGAAAFALLSSAMLSGCDGDKLGEHSQPSESWGVPISGGTLLITRDGTQAVIGDPDRNRVLVVVLASGETLADFTLEPGDEPGRLIEDGAGRIHVALRQGGALLTLDTTHKKVQERRAVCGEPRGLAWDSAKDVVHVACAGGELVTLPAAGGAATRSLRLERDLRDVLVRADGLEISTFRAAELLSVDAQGRVTSRRVPPTVKRIAATVGLPAPTPPSGDSPFAVDAVPEVAWRTVELPSGGYLMTHQRAVKGQLDGTRPGGYGIGCGGNRGPVEAALTLMRPGQEPAALQPVVIGALPVDVAVSPNGDTIAVALAGSQLIHVASSDLLDRRDDKECPEPAGTSPLRFNFTLSDELGSPTSLAWTPAAELVAYYPELPALVLRRGVGLSEARTIDLPGEVGYDAGRALFHRATVSGLACASCHPEGREDGQTWTFVETGARRTQSLAGGILARGPFHWEADMADLTELMNDVFTKRMSGGDITTSEKRALGPWLDRIPAPVPVAIADAAALARGKALFDSPQVGCSGCHGGPLFTSNAKSEVGTAGVFKAPSLLGVAARAPFMHTGCARTLRDRFSAACGGGDQHGVTSHLSAAQLDDLVLYLESL
jgi:mono/diheme cytochrome c family protein